MRIQQGMARHFPSVMTSIYTLSPNFACLFLCRLLFVFFFFFFSLTSIK
jgi:hypothetical protein